MHERQKVVHDYVDGGNDQVILLYIKAYPYFFAHLFYFLCAGAYNPSVYLFIESRQRTENTYEYT